MQAATACVSRLDVMLAAIRARSDGFICELGVYRGHSLNELARRNPSEKVYGFDTFEGLPEFWREGFPKGSFETSLDEIKFEKNCVIYKGLFHETLPIFLDHVPEVAGLVHIDCDLYSSTICALKILAPRIRPGTIILFDEYINYPGWQQHEHRALNEFLSDTGWSCEYIAYNKLGQQVAVRITEGTPKVDEE